MELKNRDEKKITSVFLVKPKGQLRPQHIKLLTSSSDVISLYQCLLGYITLKSSRNGYNRGTVTIFSQVVKNK